MMSQAIFDKPASSPGDLIRWWRDVGDSIASQMRALGRDRWKKHGCCGFRRFAFDMDVTTLSNGGGEEATTRCVRCALLGERCIFGSAVGAAERLGCINNRNVRMIDEWRD